MCEWWWNGDEVDTVLARSLLAAATLMRLPSRSSCTRTENAKFRSQNEQSAAPPAIVPSKYGLISITFFTVPLPIPFIHYVHEQLIHSSIIHVDHTDVRAHRSSWVDSNQNTMLVDKRQSSGTMRVLDSVGTIGLLCMMGTRAAIRSERWTRDRSERLAAWRQRKRARVQLLANRRCWQLRTNCTHSHPTRFDSWISTIMNER